jgi:hypothetical protein
MLLRSITSTCPPIASSRSHGRGVSHTRRHDGCGRTAHYADHRSMRVRVCVYACVYMCMRLFVHLRMCMRVCVDACMCACACFIRVQVADSDELNAAGHARALAGQRLSLSRRPPSLHLATAHSLTLRAAHSLTLRAALSPCRCCAFRCQPRRRRHAHRRRRRHAHPMRSRRPASEHVKKQQLLRS